MNTPMADPSRRVDAVFSGPARQHRATVLFRLILAIPIVFVAFFVGIALVVVVVISWFAALFMGRLPRWAHDFLSDVIPWFTRINAYVVLLTDRYPPFSFEDADYPVLPLMPAAGRLNRWTVLFRFVLLIPAAVFLQIVQYGLTIPLLFVVWLIVLVRGEMPPALYGAYAAMVRYSLRLSSYECMVTSEYAWGMLGDRPAPTFLSPPVAPSPLPPPSGTMPGGAWASPLPPAVPPQYPPPTASSGGWDVPRPAEGENRDRRSLVLAGAARGWIIFAIVWGAVVFAGQSVVQSLATRNQNTEVTQYNTVVSDYNATSETLHAAGRSVPNCETVACARPYDTAAASSLNSFAADLRAMSVAAGASSEKQHVESDISQLSSTLTALADSPNAAAYARTGTRSDLPGLLQTYSNDVQSLLNALQQSVTAPI